MVQDRVCFGQLVALALAGNDMEELRALQPAQVLQRWNQGVEVVAVDRADVVETELFEQGARRNHAFDMLLDAVGEFQRVGDRSQHLFTGATRGVEGAAGEQARQVLVEGTDRRRDRHVVVVEDHQQVGVDHAGVVERFEGLAGGHRTIADDRHDAPLLALVARRDRHAQRGGNRGG